MQDEKQSLKNGELMSLSHTWGTVVMEGKKILQNRFMNGPYPIINKANSQEQVNFVGNIGPNITNIEMNQQANNNIISIASLKIR